MKRPVAEYCLFAVVTAVTATGCYHTPQGGYGYQGAPGYQAYPSSTYPPMQYQQPIQTLTPGQPYVPSGTYSPGTGVPGSTSPTYSNPGGGLQPIPENNNAPPYTGSDSRQVPTPYFNDRNSTYNQPGMQPLGSVQPANHLQEPAPLNPPVNGLREVQLPHQPTQSAAADPAGSQASSAPLYNPVPSRNAAVSRESIPADPLTQDFAMPRTLPNASMPPNTTPPASKPLPPLENSDPFSAPQQTEAPEQPQAMPFEATLHKPNSEKMSTFGHDPEYKWLLGVVSKEPQDGTWSIVFSDSPAGNDELAGHVTFAPSPQLEKLKDGTVVEVTGQIDPLVKDALGKPVYLISELTPLIGIPK